MIYHYKLRLSQVEARLAEFRNQKVKYFYSPPKKDLSWTGLLEFVDDTVTDYSKPLPTVESTTNDLQNRDPSVTETGASPSTIISKPFIKFVKAADRPTENKADKGETIKKPAVKYAKLYKKSSKSSSIRGNQRNWNNLKSQQLENLSTVNRKFRTANRKFPTGSTKFSTADMGKKGDVVKASAKNMLFHYKAGLLQVEGRLAEFKNQEIKFCKKIRGLEIQLEFKINRIESLTNELELVKKEKGLPEFVDDTITDYSRPTPTVEMRSQFRAPWVPTVNRNSSTVNRKFPTGSTKFSTADMGKRGNTVKASACWIWKPRHNTTNKGNISYLSDYKPFDGGYVSFGQGGCKVTGKGTIKAKCIVLERNIKLSDDTNVLLRTPRQHNMYFIDLNNIVPHKDLTCLVAKASADECMLWHRRLGHLNFKTMNKLVHDALLESTSSNAQDTCTTDAPESSRNPNPTTSTKNPPADPMETLAVETPIPTFCLFSCFLSQEKPKNVSNALQDPSWVEAMQEELFQFKIQNVWSLVDCPKRVRPIGTKWVLKNKKDGRGIVIRNKAKLVAQRHTQEEGIDYDEVFAHVARIKAIRLFLAYASFMGFTVYQMDVKSVFFYGTIDEEVYVMQPPGFQDPKFPARVYKVEKAMYGLHQAPRAWHQVTLKECHMHAVKRVFRYLKGHPKLGLWYPKESPFDLVAYSDSDYGGGTQDRKSTTGGCQFLGRRLISWQCKKQTIMATSTTEAEYVAAASSYGQVLWIQNQLLDYGLSMLCEALSKEISSSILLLSDSEQRTHEFIHVYLASASV
nr:putative ribonuclease H-like domain-containing protein [Tanacetum cinerariifolium]